MRLSDGTIIPHYMGVRDIARASGAPGFFDEVAILPGEVVKVIYPDDPDNSSGQFTEYTVMVWRRQSNGPQERIVFRCFQADTFGSVADWFRFSFRAATSDPNGEALSNGATVFIACINGDRSNAYIIGAMPQPNRDEMDPRKSEGRYLRSRFNGVEMRINDDGSFELLVPGATDVNGKPDPNRNGDNKGSKLSFAANGDIAIDDQAGDSVKVNPGSKTIEVSAGSHITKVDQKWKLKAAVVEVVANEVTVDAPIVNLGGNATSINPLDGVVVGTGIDTFTGAPYVALGNASVGVKAKK